MKKLVRDLIPESVQHVIYRRAEVWETVNLYRDKLIEDYDGLIAAAIDSHDAGELEKLGDLLQVLKSLAQRCNVPWSQVETAQRTKWQRSGGYEELWVLEENSEKESVR